MLSQTRTEYNAKRRGRRRLEEFRHGTSTSSLSHAPFVFMSHLTLPHHTLRSQHCAAVVVAQRHNTTRRFKACTSVLGSRYVGRQQDDVALAKPILEFARSKITSCIEQCWTEEAEEQGGEEEEKQGGHDLPLHRVRANNRKIIISADGKGV